MVRRLRRPTALDANFQIRAVLGRRVRRILEAHADSISFFVPLTAYAEAEEHLAALVVKRGGNPTQALAALRSMAALGTVVSSDIYRDVEAEARKRLGARDPDDWPILAAALALGCPIWTEDTEFFGCDVATWTSASIDSFFAHYHSRSVRVNHRLAANHGFVDVAGTESEPGQRPSA